jgi:hypothetical protein
MKTRAKLLHAKDKKLIIHFFSRFEHGSFTGFVLDVGPTFILLASLDDACAFENYTCLRIQDVRKLQSPAKYSEFYIAARKAGHQRMPRRIKLDLTDAASILQSAAPSLVTVHRDKHHPGTCQIGYSLSDNGTHLEMLEITPGAVWETEPTYYRLKQITRIDLPGPYERALLLVGGLPRNPAKTRSPNLAQYPSHKS